MAAAKPLPDSLEVRPFASSKAFEQWLDRHHGSSAGLWLKLAKKDAGIASVTYAEAVEVALCWGWIDGQKRPFDEAWWLQRFTPRKARSPWSEINRGKVADLIAAGRMRPSGQAEIDAAKADGRWERAYAPQSKAEVPEDLARALAANPKAKAHFEKLTGANRYAVIVRLVMVKKADTRTRKVAEFTAKLAEGWLPYPGK